MDKKIYMAPMEGVTDSIYRRTFKKYYGGVDKYFTPFLAPNSTKKFPTREWKEIDPATNDVTITVPQLLTNNASHFLWAVKEIAPLGFKEINFNLGCPSATVVTKKKGSGLLAFPEELDHLLYDIFDGISSINDAPTISVKTRIGKDSPEEFFELLDIYNKYPISELTIHPRVQTEFYKGEIHKDIFKFACENTSLPLVFNGDITGPEIADDILREFPNINGIMLGRGLISNSSLALSIQGIAVDDNPTRFKEFHNELLDLYEEVLSGEKPVLFRMKEFWGFWEKAYPDYSKQIKKIKKANRVADYKAAVGELL